jgi:hypothetical protein
MQDIIEAAKSMAARNGAESDRNWVVTFIDGESRTGQLKRLGAGNYSLTKSDRTYYFHVDKVIRVYEQ